MKNKMLKISGASSDSLFLIFVKLITIILGMCVTRILASSLSIGDYGTYSQIMLMVSTISSLTILGMADGVNYFFYKSEDKDDREKNVSTIFALQYIIGSLCGICLMLCTKYIIKYFDNTEISNLMLFAAVLPFFQNIISILQVLFISIGKAKQIAIRNLIISISRLICFFIACHVLQSVAAILFFTVMLDVLQILYFRIVLKKNGCIISVKQIRLAKTRKIVSYCFPMAVFLILNTLTRDCDRYVISAYTDTKTLAIYTNASKILPFDIIMSSFCTVLLPYLTQYIVNKKYKNAKELYGLFFELSYMTTAILAGCAIVAAPMLMQLLYSSKYLVGINIFVIYIIVDIFRFTNITLVLSAAGETKKLMCISGVGLVLNLLLNIILFNKVGIIGPAISTLIVTILSGLAIQISSAKIIKSNLWELFSLKRAIRFFAWMILGILIFSGLSQWINELQISYIYKLFILGSGFGLFMLLGEAKRIVYLIKQINTYKL